MAINVFAGFDFYFYAGPVVQISSQPWATTTNLNAIYKVLSRNTYASFRPGQISSLTQLEPGQYQIDAKVSFDLPGVNTPAVPRPDYGLVDNDTVILSEAQNGTDVNLSSAAPVAANVANLTVAAVRETALNSGVFEPVRLGIGGSTGLALLGINGVPPLAVPDNPSLYQPAPNVTGATELVVYSPTLGEFLRATLDQVAALVVPVGPAVGSWNDTFTDDEDTLLTDHTGEDTPGGYIANSPSLFAVKVNRAEALGADAEARFALSAPIPNGSLSVNLKLLAATAQPRSALVTMKRTPIGVSPASGLFAIFSYDAQEINLSVRDEATLEIIFGPVSLGSQVPDGALIDLNFKAVFTGNNYDLLINNVSFLTFSHSGVESNTGFGLYSSFAGNSFNDLVIEAL